MGRWQDLLAICPACSGLETTERKSANMERVVWAGGVICLRLYGLLMSEAGIETMNLADAFKELPAFFGTDMKRFNHMRLQAPEKHP